MKGIVTRILFVTAAAVFLCVAANAQSKPGLWESSTTMKMAGQSMPKIPPETLEKMKASGIKIPGLDGAATKLKLCVTQEMIDKYGGPQPQTQKECQIENMQHSGGGFSADLVCTGHMTGKGSIKATHVDSTHTTMAMHFSGTTEKGRPVEWSMEGSSVYLSAACGDVQPGHPVLE